MYVLFDKFNTFTIKYMYQLRWCLKPLRLRRTWTSLGLNKKILRRRKILPVLWLAVKGPFRHRFLSSDRVLLISRSREAFCTLQANGPNTIQMFHVFKNPPKNLKFCLLCFATWKQVTRTCVCEYFSNMHNISVLVYNGYETIVYLSIKKRWSIFVILAFFHNEKVFLCRYFFLNSKKLIIKNINKLNCSNQSLVTVVECCSKCAITHL